MSLFIKGNELYSKHFPVVGMQPTLYGFNNLSGILNPYVNVRMYDGWSGRVLPDVAPGTLLSEMINNFKSNPTYTEYDKKRIRSSLYNNDTKKFTIGLIGTEADILIARKALDEHMNKP